MQIYHFFYDNKISVTRFYKIRQPLEIYNYLTVIFTNKTMKTLGVSMVFSLTLQVGIYINMASNLTDTILERASVLMDKYGISSVTMDDIAKECHISKRTLYEQIPDKRTLVWYCILFDRQRKQNEAINLISESPSTLVALLHICRHMRITLTETSSVFFKDLHRLYPDLEKKCRDMHRERAQEFGTFLSKGISEGMFRSDIDLNLAAEVFMVQSVSIMKELGVSSKLLAVKKMIDTAFVIFLRGLATQKGLEVIDNFLKENNI